MFLSCLLFGNIPRIEFSPQLEGDLSDLIAVAVITLHEYRGFGSRHMSRIDREFILYLLYHTCLFLQIGCAVFLGFAEKREGSVAVNQDIGVTREPPAYLSGKVYHDEILHARVTRCGTLKEYLRCDTRNRVIQILINQVFK